MGRVRIPALMMALALLAGCGRAEAVEGRFEKFRRELTECESAAFRLEVSEDLGSEVFDCTLDCTVSGGEICCRVAEPESIAGVTARIAEGKTQVEYDGVIMTVPGGGPSPVLMAAELVNALKSGHVKTAWTEGGDRPADVLSFYIDGQSEISVWLDREGGTPFFAEIQKNGETVLKCGISGLTLK